MFSQDSSINDDVFFGGHSTTMITMPSPNMALGDMVSFLNSLPWSSCSLTKSSIVVVI